MGDQQNDKIKLYTSSTCPHSWAVTRFLRRNAIAVDQISIDGNPTARAELMALSNGYASVPTLVFPDGTQLTEPGFRELRRQLGIEKPSLLSRLFDGKGRA
ncbi:MAG: glutaredoxin family protein [Anaerolineae bacterium]|nr:glutaredoxin family protein [Anaerolineae bacterium]